MEPQIIIAIVIAMPVVLLPLAVLWHMNIAGVSSRVRQAMSRKVIKQD